MREILFRGKREDNQEWVYGYYFANNGEVAIIEKDEYCYFSHDCLETDSANDVIPETVGQYTGLADKNGKKIFEGDILRQYADNTELGTDLYFFYKVSFDEEFAKFSGIDINNNDLYYFDDLEDIEVIGNIFDNPELLESEV